MILRTTKIMFIILFGGIASCSSTWESVTKETLQDNDMLVMQADVSGVIRSKVGEDSKHGRITPDYITCSMPSPDVAKVMSESFNTGASLSVEGLPEDVKPRVAVAIARERAQSAAQLGERLATIQLLRDGLYRACEAYANGAISDTTYAVLLSRYDDTMVTMLGSELAAGAFGRSLAALGSEASGSSAATADIKKRQTEHRDAMSDLKEIRTQKSDLQSELRESQTESLQLEKELSEAFTKKLELVAERHEKIDKIKNLESAIKTTEEQIAQLDRDINDPANASRQEELTKQLDKTTTQLDELHTEKDQTDQQIRDETGELAKIEKDIRDKTSSIVNIKKEIRDQSEDLSKVEKLVESSEKTLDTKLEATAAGLAKGTFQAGGTITPGQQHPEIAQTLATIAKEYIENINSDALVVACISALDRTNVKEVTEIKEGNTITTITKDEQTGFADACPMILNEVRAVQGKILLNMFNSDNIAVRREGEKLETLRGFQKNALDKAFKEFEKKFAPTPPKVPKHAATGIKFTDTNEEIGKLAGKVTIYKAGNEENITKYLLYWGVNATSILPNEPPIAIIEKGKPLTFDFPKEKELIPLGASYLLVYTANEEGRMGTGISIPHGGRGDSSAYKATEILFKDTDKNPGELSGNVTIKKAKNEDLITEYVLYWGLTAAEKMPDMEAIRSFKKTGNDLTYPFPDNTPQGKAEYLIVRTVLKDTVVEADGISLKIIDVDQ